VTSSSQSPVIRTQEFTGADLEKVHLGGIIAFKSERPVITLVTTSPKKHDFLAGVGSSQEKGFANSGHTLTFASRYLFDFPPSLLEFVNPPETVDLANYTSPYG
jgi:hypothetical protein